MSWIQQCTYGYVQYTYDNFNIKKNFVFWSWKPTKQLARDARPMVIGIDKP
jgi:hypothetical protein